MSILHSFLNDLRARALRGSETTTRSRMGAEPLESRIAPAAALTTTMVDTWNDADGDGEVEPGEIISYEVIITNTGDAMTTNGVRFEDLLEANLVLVSGSLNVSPLALDDAYTAVRNTQLQVGPVAGAPTGPQLSVTGSLFDNDREFLTDNFTLSAIGATAFGGSPTTITLGSGSTVRVDAEGNFTYLPAAGFAGASETFTYTIRDDGTDGVAGNADDLSSVGTVTINLAAQEVWYVDNSYVGVSDGTSVRPFTSLGAVTGATGPDGIGDIIYIATGSGAYTGTMALLNGQKLLGAAVALTIPGVGTLQAAGVRPVINASGDAVTVSATAGAMENIEIRGLSLQGTGNAIDITASGFNAVGVTIDNNIFAGAGAEAVDLNAGATTAFGVTFTNNTVNASTGNAFDARTSTASAAMTLNVSNNTITSTTTGILIDGAGGGPITITGFANNTITGNTGGGGVTINSAVFDASGVSGFQVVNAGALTIGALGNGVGTTGLILTNVRGDLGFSDLDIYTSSGAGLRATSGAVFSAASGTGFQLAVASNVSVIDATGGAALDLDTVLLNLQGAAVKSTNSTTYGVNLLNVDGSTLTTTNSPSSGISGLVGASSVAFRVENSTGNITFNGPISTSVGTGVELENNTGATISLGGTLTISSGANVAFTATGGGTVNVTGSGNTLTTTTATALNVVNATIGSGNLNFQSISSTTVSGNSAIVLNNTGTAAGNGGLIVTGSGTAGSGGTISNKTVDGISLTSTRGVSLSRMVIDNNDGSGIAGTNVTNFSLINSTVSNNADSATGVEAGLRFTNLLGTAAITSTTFVGQSEDHVRITNNSGTLTNLTISGSTFNANSAATGGHGISMINTGTAAATITVSTTNFTGIRSSAILVNGTDTTVSTLNVSGGTFTNIGSAVTVQSDQSADLSFNVSGITSTGAISNAIQLVAGSTSTPNSNIVGVISSNVIGNSTADSGSRDMYGIAIDLRGDQDSILSINSNNIQHTDISGIWVNQADFGTLAGPSARMDLHLLDNTVGVMDDNSAFPFFTVYGVLVDIRHTTTAYLDVAGNSSTGLGGFEGFRFRQRDTAVVHVERLTDGDGTPNELITNLFTVQSFFVSQNDAGSTVNVSAAAGFGFTEAANGIVRDPLLFLPTAAPVVVTPPPAEETPSDTVTPPEITDEPVNNPPTAPEDPGIADDGILSDAELDTLVSAAIARWAATGLSAEQIALLESVTFVVSDLSGWSLGAASGTSVTLDTDAAGNEWFVDATPNDDIEFVGSGSRMTATINGGANGRVDALTTIMHELGHVLGLEDSYDSADRESLMYGWIGAGERRLAQAGEAEGADPSEHASEPVEFIGGPINIGDLPAGKGVTIHFQATVNPAIMVGQVSNQGFVRDSGGTLLATTDDPDAAGTANPTVTLVDLPDVTVGVSAPTVSEDGAGTLTYTFTREGSTGHAITVNFNLGGTALSASDFSISGTGVTFDGTTGTIVIPVGSSTATITLSPTDDMTVEADETAIVNVLAGPVAAPGYDVGVASSATGTILNDDTDVSVAVSPVSVSEDGAGNLVYTFTRTGMTSGAHTVNFSLTGSGTLTAADYALISSPGVTFDSGTGLGTISFAAGELTNTVILDPTADSIVESDEAATITVQSGTGYNVAGTAALGTITNDDTDVTLAITPASVSEDGAGNLVYTLTRNGVTSTALTVNFNVGGTAIFNTDYTQTGAATFTSSVGTVTFAPGATTATVTMNPMTDSTVEGDETTLLTLTAGTGYNAVTATAVQGTITNDDTDVTLSVAPASVSEDGAGLLFYTFTRTGITTGALTVNFSVGGTATFDTDYRDSGATTFTSSVGSVTFAAGETTAVVRVDPSPDPFVEGDETVALTITAGTGYNAATPSAATGTITNDDTTVSLAVSPASVFENSGGALTYTFTRAGVTTGAITVNFDVSGNAAFNTDYTQSGAATFTSSVGSITFAPGASTATVTLTPLSDDSLEGDETAALTIAAGSGYQVITPGAVTGTILNDDAEVTLAVSPASVTEDGAGNLVYTFTRTGYTAAALTVNFNVGGGTTFNTDYTQTGAGSFDVSSGTVTFAAGSNTATVTVDPTQDSVGETDETVALTLANGTGYTLGTPTAATGTILNDDTFVSIAMGPGNILEGSGAGLVYTITRTGDTSTALTVNFNVAGTAAFTSDYTQSGAATYSSGLGTIVIPAGSASATVTLTNVNDTLVEGAESTELTLTGGAGYSLGGTTTATGTLDDNDTAIVRLTSATSTATEGGATPNIGVELVITADGNVGTGTLARAVSLNLDVLNGGTAGLADFTFTDPTTVTFAIGQSSSVTNVPVTIVNDAAVEGDETLQFALNGFSDGTGGSVTLSGTTAHTLTIADNDTAMIGFAAASGNHDEGAGASSLGFILTIIADGTGTPTLERDVTFHVNSTGGSAIAGTDYTIATAVTFAAGALHNAVRTTSLTLTNDALVEGSETASFGLAIGSDATGGRVSIATGAAGSHTAAIVDNDTATISFATAASTVGEGAGNDALGFVLNITANGTGTPALARNVTFNVNTAAGGTANIGADYAVPATVTFATGAGQGAMQSASLAISNDAAVEGTETASLSLVIATDGTGGQVTIATGANHITTITDNDTATVRYFTTTSSFSEGFGNGFSVINYVLSISADGVGTPTLERDVTVDAISIPGGTASPTDYTLPASKTFVAGTMNNASHREYVGVVNDTLVEGPETVTLGLAIGSDGTGGQVTVITGPEATHTLAIADNDTATIQFLHATGVTPEGLGANVGVVLTLTANGVAGSGTLERNLVVPIGATGGTASEGLDYAFVAPQSVQFTAGSEGSTQFALISINDDTLVEGMENLNLSFGQISMPVFMETNISHNLSVLDNDTARIEFVGASTVTNENAGTHRFDVRLIITANGEENTGSLAEPIRVTLPELSGDTAILGEDYTVLVNSLFFAAGATSSVQGIDVRMINDARVEGSETMAFGLQITVDGTNGQASLGTETNHTVTIGDNDIATLSLVSDGSTVGEAGGTHNIGVALVITANGEGTPMLERNVSVNLRDLVAGTATPGGSDYQFNTPQTITFAPGETNSTKHFSVGIVDDTRLEGNESVTFQAEAFTDGTLGQVTFTGSNSHAVTITDNESATIALSATAGLVNEAAGSLPVGVTLVITANGVTGAGTLEQSVSVNLSDLLNGSATANGTDYTFATPQTVTFAAGEGGSTKSLPITVIDDQISEGNETLTLQIGGLIDATGLVTLTPGTSAITIIDNDVDLSVVKTESSAVVVAGSGAGNLTYTITVTNSGATDATGVVLSEDLNLPSGVSIVSITPSIGAFNIGTAPDGEWTIGNLAAGSNATLTVVLTVDASAAEGLDLISNTATITGSNEVRVNTADDSDMESTSIDRQVDLVITKTDGVTNTAPGTTLTYTINYRNDGPSDATGVVLTEYLPEGTLFNAAASGAWIEVEPGIYRLTVGNLATGASGNTAFAVNVSSPAQAGLNSIENDASIADDGSAGADVDPADNLATDIDTLEALPDLQISVDDIPVTAVRGGITSYLVTYANLGSQDATGVTITMTLPANTVFDPFASTGIWELVAPGVYSTAIGDVLAGADAGSVAFAVQVAANVGSDFLALSTTATISDDGANGADSNSDNNTDKETTPLYQGIYAVAPGVALPNRREAPVVRVFDVATGTQMFEINAYDPTYRDSIRIAVGDINGDGYDDIITSTRKGTGSVRVFDGVTGQRFEGPFSQIDAFTEKGARGAFVASGDVTGDGRDDIIVGSGQGARGAGKVKVFDGTTGELVSTSEPFGAKFRGGVRVAVGDVNGDGIADIIAAKGIGGNDIKITSGASTEVLRELEVGGPRYRGGVFVASGDLDGDGSADVVAGRDRGLTSVETFNGATGTPMRSFVPFAENYRLGARVAVADVNLDGIADVVVAAGGRGRSEVKFFSGIDDAVLHTFTAFPANLSGSLFVAGSSPVPSVASAIQQPL